MSKDRTQTTSTFAAAFMFLRNLLSPLRVFFVTFRLCSRDLMSGI